MKVLVIGEKYSANLGDGAICDSVAYLIRQKYPHAEITFADFSGRVGYYSSNNKRISYQRRNIQMIKKIIANILSSFGVDVDYYKHYKYSQKTKNYVRDICGSKYDVAIFAGGQLLKDSFVFPIKAFIDKLQENATPIIFNAVGVGSLKSRRMRSVLNKSLMNKNVRWISTRDDIDWINELISFKRDVFRISDPAVWSSNVYSVGKEYSDVVGLGIMYVNDMRLKDVHRFWLNVVSKLNEEKRDWKMFCNGSLNDYIFAKDLLTDMGYEGHELEKRLVKRPETPDELVNIISKFSSIISFRLHSHIIAYSLDIPAIALVWDPKVRHFYKSINLGHRCKTINDNTESIFFALQKAEADRYDHALKKEIMKKTAEHLIMTIEDCLNWTSASEGKR